MRIFTKFTFPRDISLSYKVSSLSCKLSRCQKGWEKMWGLLWILTFPCAFFMIVRFLISWFLYDTNFSSWFYLRTFPSLNSIFSWFAMLYSGIKHINRCTDQNSGGASGPPKPAQVHVGTYTSAFRLDACSSFATTVGRFAWSKARASARPVGPLAPPLDQRSSIIAHGRRLAL